MNKLHITLEVDDHIIKHVHVATECSQNLETEDIFWLVLSVDGRRREVVVPWSFLLKRFWSSLDKGSDR